MSGDRTAGGHVNGHANGHNGYHQFPWLTAEQLARALGKARKAGGQWMADCPAHPDGTPSLAIRDGDNGKPLVKCHAGCSQDAVLTKLRARGLWPDMAVPIGATRPAASKPAAWQPMLPVPDDAPEAPANMLRCDMLHEYRDADGRLLFYIRRHEARAGKAKQFYPLTYGRLDGKQGWHCKAPGNPAPLYGLDRLATAEPNAPVVLCEGEKGADAAGRLLPNYVAMSWMGGANKADQADVAPVAKCDVVVWGDADAPGREAAARIAARIPGARILNTEGLPDGFDAADLEADGTSIGEAEAWLSERLPETETRPIDREPDQGDALPFTLFADIQPCLEANDFVEGLLSTSSLAVVYGEPGSRKTFWVLDIALHVAAGRRWRDREVEKGAVIYLALEGGAGIRNRIAAARERLGLPDDTPLVLVQCPVDLCHDNGDVRKVVDTIQAVGKRLAMPVRMVVVDTLARAIAGGNENAPEDMGSLVAHCDEIRHETGTCVLLVHHSGKDTAKGSRGHSSLKAATDTEIEVTCDGEVSVARVTRQRDLESEGRFAFRLDQVELGTNRRGKPVTSCVVETADPPSAKAGRVPLSNNERIGLRTLDRAMEASGMMATVFDNHTEGSVVRVADWRAWFYREGLPDADGEAKRKAFQRVISGLIAKGLIGSQDGLIWPKGPRV